MTRVPLLGASIVAWLALASIGPAWADCMTSCMAGKGCGLQALAPLDPDDAPLEPIVHPRMGVVMFHSRNGMIGAQFR